MEIFTLAFWSSFVVIIGIDLFLAGDNAIVIALAAGRLPRGQRTRAVLYGTVGAVIIRILCTVSVVYLLMIPGLHFAGGAMLVWIAYKLLIPAKKSSKKIEAAPSIWAAVRTIIIADALMSLDNMLAVAGAAQNDPLLVILGLLVSVPLLMGGSAVIMRLIDRYQWLIYLGSAILAMTAGRMLFAEPFVRHFFGALVNWVEWPVVLVIIAAVLFLGHLQAHKSNMQHKQNQAV
ncbi:MAG: TerC family protein [Sporolactobacillus sp.]